MSQSRQIANRNDSEESMKELVDDMDILNLRRTQYEIKQEKEAIRTNSTHLKQSGKNERISSWLLNS